MAVIAIGKLNFSYQISKFVVNIDKIPISTVF